MAKRKKKPTDETGDSSSLLPRIQKLEKAAEAGTIDVEKTFGWCCGQNHLVACLGAFKKQSEATIRNVRGA